MHAWLGDKEISFQTQVVLSKALEFSFVIEGAHIRYNYLIANRAKNFTHAEKINVEFEHWLNQANSYPERFRQQSIDDWYYCAFDEGGRANHRTRTFIENWCHLIRVKAKVGELDRCVEKQAIANKGARCLLKKALPENQGWVGDAKVGISLADRYSHFARYSGGLKC